MDESLGVWSRRMEQMLKFRRASGMPDTKASVSSSFPRLNSGLDLLGLRVMWTSGRTLLDDLADLFGLRVMWLVRLDAGRSGGGAFGRSCMIEGGAFPSPTTMQSLSI